LAGGVRPRAQPALPGRRRCHDRHRHRAELRRYRRLAGRERRDQGGRQSPSGLPRRSSTATSG
jgi:hypothetical protein